MLETGHSELIEDSDFDTFWGGALPGAKNMCGKMLMELRDTLRNEKLKSEYPINPEWDAIHIPDGTRINPD